MSEVPLYLQSNERHSSFPNVCIQTLVLGLQFSGKIVMSGRHVRGVSDRGTSIMRQCLQVGPYNTL